MAQQGQSTMNQPVATPGAGFAIFAGVMMVIMGLFEAFQGLAAIINDSFFLVGPNYTYNIDVSDWGWVHLILGVVVMFAGMAVFSGKTWARVIGIILAILSAVANFLWIPYYPFWSILIIGIDLAIVWGLANFTEDEASRGDY